MKNSDQKDNLKKMVKEKDEIAEKWRTMGFLDKLDDTTNEESRKSELAHIYENLSHYILDNELGNEDDERYYEVTTFIFPIMCHLYVDEGITDYKDVLNKFTEWFMSLEETPNEVCGEDGSDDQDEELRRVKDKEVLDKFKEYYLNE